MKRIDLPPAPRIDARDLRLVLALAYAGTTAAAADALFLTQSAVSRALLGLEDRLGALLFERTPQGLSPTHAGQTVLDSAAQLLAELDDLAQRIAAEGQAPRRLRLVCECYTAYHWLPGVLADLRQRMPGLEWQIAVEHTQHPVAALQAGEIDVALLTDSALPRGSVDERTLFMDEIVFVVAADGPLAQVPALSPAHLSSLPLLTTHPPTPQTRWFNQAVRSTARHPVRYQKLPLTEAMLDFARAGMGIAVLSEWIAAPQLARGDLLPKRLAAGPVLRPWRLAWRREVQEPALRLHGALQHRAPRLRELPPVARPAPRLRKAA